MEKLENVDLPSITPNNTTQYKNLSQKYKNGHTPLNIKADFEISDED